MKMHKHGGDVYEYPGFLDFSANINFLGIPPKVRTALQESLEKIMHYPQPGCSRLRSAIGKLEQVRPEQVICGNGAAELIFSLVQAVRPRHALIPMPAFQEYEQALRAAGCQVTAAPFGGIPEAWDSGASAYVRPLPAPFGGIPGAEESRRLEQEFLAQIKKGTDLVFFCNPNNPTGLVTGRERLLRLLARCRETGALLAVDECFLDFLPEGEAITLKPYLDQYPELFLVKSFTKMFAIPGLRLGYGLCSDEGLLEKMARTIQPWSVSVPAQEAGIAAAGETGFMEQTRQAVEREKAFFLGRLERFREAGNFPVEVLGAGANYIFFRSSPGLDGALKEYHILIRDCSNFRGLEEGFYRIAVRSRPENEKLLAALEALNAIHGTERGKDTEWQSQS